ncbi:hypothetical protein DFAR_1560010 [Desulfarculales bacterium]
MHAPWGLNSNRSRIKGLTAWGRDSPLTGKGSTAMSNKINWLEDWQKALVRAKDEDKSIFLDFFMAN